MTGMIVITRRNLCKLLSRHTHPHITSLEVTTQHNTQAAATQQAHSHTQCGTHAQVQNTFHFFANRYAAAN